MAGYSLGQSDLRIRKVLAKKKIKEIPVVRNEFVYGKKTLRDDNNKIIGLSEEPCGICKGAINNGYSEEFAGNIFDDMEGFASYCFNKSHSGAYSALGYKTGWLSCYHPVEWSCSCLQTYYDSDKISETLKLCKRRGIPLLPPNVNKSFIDFSIESSNNKKGIRYGLVKVKFVSKNGADFIVKIREKIGREFYSFDDFYQQVTNRDYINELSKKENKNGLKQNPVDKKTISALINCGAFDDFEENRYTLLNYYNMVIRKEKDYVILKEKDYTRKIKLSLELEYIGSYLSEHPLDPFPSVDFNKVQDEEQVEFAGIIKKFYESTTKTGRPRKYGSVIVETKDGLEHRFSVFDNYEKTKKTIKKIGAIIVVYGVYKQKYRSVNASKVLEVKSTSSKTTSFSGKKINSNTKPKEEKIIKDVYCDESSNDLSNIVDFFDQFN